MNPWIIEHQKFMRGDVDVLSKPILEISTGGDTRITRPASRLSLPCVNLGEAIREQSCGCGSKYRVCEVYDKCTTMLKRPDVQCCVGCKDYQSSGTELDDRRHLIYFIYPIAGNGVWQWNVEELKKRVHLFNGRRTVAICNAPATRRHTLDTVKTVRTMLGEGFDTIEVPQTNTRRLGEVTAFKSLLHSVEPFIETRDTTFYAHAKGVLSKTTQWADLMYRACLDDIPTFNHITGAFRRPKSVGFPWHYSGTFYWFKNASVFSREWDRIPQRYGGTEMWPSRLFSYDESECLFGDNPPGSLYNQKVIDSYVG